MYKVIKKISNVIRIIVIDSDLFYSDKNSDLFKNSELICSKIDSASIYKISDFLFVHYEEGGYCYYKKGLIKKDFGLVINNLNSGILLGHSKPKRISRGVYEREYFIIDRRDFKISDTIIKSTKIDFDAYTNNLALGVDDNVINAFSIKEKSFLWQFPLSQFGKFVSDWGEERDYEIEQFIGICNNILWIKISFFSGGLIGLDVKTGELRHQLKVSDDFIGSTSIKSIKNNEVPFYRCNYSLLDDGRIIGLAIDIYYEVDLTLDEPKVTAYGLDDEYQKFGIDKEDISRNSVLQEKHLYFYNHNQHIFAILNTETKKIIYISDKIDVPDTQEAWGQLKDLKVSRDKVYILDSTRTLHIFEQEPNKKITA